VILATLAKRDFYEVLGIARSASEQEIKSAFARKATEFQAGNKPRNIDDVEEIRTLATAYRVLSDAEKRRVYDRSGNYLPVDPGLTSEDWGRLDELSKASQSDWKKAGELIAGIVSGFVAGLDLD
jgi:DnaJ-class molecular chaperone